MLGFAGGVGFAPSGTRVLSYDLAKGATLGPELLSLSQQQMDSGWAITGESTVSGGVGRILSTAGALSQLTASGLILTVGKHYHITYDVISKTAGGMTTGDNAALTSNIGANAVSYTATTTGFGFKRSGITDITIDNVSIKEILPVWRPLGT